MKPTIMQPSSAFLYLLTTNHQKFKQIQRYIGNIADTDASLAAIQITRSE